MMYFSQLVSTMRNPFIQVVTTEESTYAGKLLDLPFSLFRGWHDYKVLEITPMYATDEQKPFLRIEIEYAERGKK
jgi:hypothetical protein